MAAIDAGAPEETVGKCFSFVRFVNVSQTVVFFGYLVMCILILECRFGLNGVGWRTHLKEVYIGGALFIRICPSTAYTVHAY